MTIFKGLALMCACVNVSWFIALQSETVAWMKCFVAGERAWGLCPS